MYTLSELADEGHVYAERDQLIRKASALLEAEDTSIIMTMDQMLKDEELIREKIMVPQFAPDEVIPEDAAKEIEKECIYLPPFYFAEVGVANKLKKLAEEPAADRLWVSLMKARQDTGNPELSVDVKKIQNIVNMEYDGVQAEAVLDNGLCQGFYILNFRQIADVLQAHLRRIRMQPIRDLHIVDCAVRLGVNIYGFLFFGALGYGGIFLLHIFGAVQLLV